MGRLTPECLAGSLTETRTASCRPQAAQQLSSRLHQCTDSNLFNAWRGNPAMTFAVIAGRIHGETLNMWLKGVRYLGRTLPTKTTTPSEPTPPIAALAARSPKAASSRWSVPRRGSPSDRSERPGLSAFPHALERLPANHVGARLARPHAIALDLGDNVGLLIAGRHHRGDGLLARPALGVQSRVDHKPRRGRRLTADSRACRADRWRTGPSRRRAARRRVPTLQHTR